MNKSFSKNVLTLMTGTGIAQAIPIAIIPILTRIFSPEDFGLLALYAACVSILGVVATGRYEIAIMLPKDDEDARLLLQLSMLVALFFSFLISIPISIWNAQIARFLGNEDIAVWLYLIPVSVLFTGIYQALTYWNNRQKKFINTAVSRVNQSLFQGFAQTSLGFLQVSGGLICGQFVGIVSGSIYLLKKDRNYKSLIRKSKINSIQKQGIKYHKFPTYGVWGALCDAGAVQMPVILLTKFYSNSVTGMFSLTFRVLNMPTSIISSAIAQVLFQKVVEISQTEPEKLNLYIIKMFLLLFIIYFPAVPVLFIWGESLFSIIFGNEWSQAGGYAGYLVIAVAVRFAVSPLSAVLGLEQNIKMGVLWQVLYLCTISVTLYFSSSLSIEEFLIAFVVHEVVLYLIYLFLILKGTKEIAKC
ncbi:lipopolysaccharide biosynthesis protein [Vibrio cholerae]|uniref:lipopolysaccharide biosynthesis protein n=1 Tax=Vibrio cholerae TaxID=666 RepID=UPI001DB4D732|nr:oligosaccharide flippase family protein [Vibrio cholerae]EKF9123593.1 oligosaccharide flippase family protein [Vibrio cholerae]EKF9142369.1 oligosaccharide flippase family protein [Vibrio cholerae]UWY93067.1 oligosaccharide flippase family protein [Vibrio cholerae]UWY96629.1 oligosaccharide flippase family protein [Vibrio cholerae]